MDYASSSEEISVTDDEKESTMEHGWQAVVKIKGKTSRKLSDYTRCEIRTSLTNDTLMATQIK